MAVLKLLMFRLFYSILQTALTSHRCEGVISIEDHRKLHLDLLKETYDPLLRPANDTSRPVEVGFRFTPTISILDDVKQWLELLGMLKLCWYDFRLQWEPSEHNGINITDIPMMRSGELTIWIPELVLNESLETAFGSFQPESYVARLDYTGFVQWFTWAATKSFCLVDVSNYPFDRQTCILTFTTWVYQTDKQVFFAIDDIIVNQTYKEYQVNQGVWDALILDVETGNMAYGCHGCFNEEQSFLRYSILLTRKQNVAYFFNLILPCLVMSAMTMLVIFLPQGNDSDTATFGLTCVLTLIVFMTFLFSILPSTGQPLLGYYVVWLTVESIVITVYAVCDAHHVTSKNDTNETDAKRERQVKDEVHAQLELEEYPSVENDKNDRSKTHETEKSMWGFQRFGKVDTGVNGRRDRAITVMFWPAGKPVCLNRIRCVVLTMKLLSTFFFTLLFLIKYSKG